MPDPGSNPTSPKHPAAPSKGGPDGSASKLRATSSTPKVSPSSHRRPSKLFNTLRDFLQPKSETREVSHAKLAAQFSNISARATALDGRQLARAIDQTVPLSDRRVHIRALCHYIQYQPVEHIEALWLAVEDLVVPSADPADRHLTLRFMSDLIKGQYNRLGILRTVFYDVLCRCQAWEDFPWVILCLRQLTRDGKDLYACERKLLPHLLWWVDEALQRKDRTPFATPDHPDENSPAPAAVPHSSAIPASPASAKPIGSTSQSASSFITATLSSIFSGGGTMPSSLSTPTPSPLPSEPEDTSPDVYLDGADTVIENSLSFIRDVIKINFPIIQIHHIDQLIHYFCCQINDYWRPAHIILLIQIIRCIMMLGQVPKSTMPTFFRLLSILINLSDPQLYQELDREIIGKLVNTHYYFYAIQELTAILQDPSDRANLHLCHGAMYLLNRWVWGHPEPQNAEPFYGTFLHLTAEMLRPAPLASSAIGRPPEKWPPLLMYDIMYQVYHFVRSCAPYIVTNQEQVTLDFAFRITTVEWEAVLLILERYITEWVQNHTSQLAAAP
ncbi:hypothetical protein BJ085DRAFT_29808 [Dimargaris cristalligena]|uniref:Tuberin N-terminal domain-containing protein n=1 Tax=Dimargaris cristalligena TaxID=215637 RepID=A0A4Q0A0R2_9FUNG|nr:hypothetical protein BJ085DRAFT_29808 [Dimargaris cristalligena]|eukprot:RKP38862.1 hypothetical protein BJ085DRAFT_29808 [Dimargaris cristalligena]